MIDTSTAKAQLAALEEARAAIQRSWPSTVDRLRLHMIGCFMPLKKHGLSLANLEAARDGFLHVAEQMADVIAIWQQGEKELAELREALRPIHDLTAAIKRQLDKP